MKKFGFGVFVVAASLVLASCSTKEANENMESAAPIAESTAPQQELTELLEQHQYDVVLKEESSEIFLNKGYSFSLNDERVNVVACDSESQVKDMLANISDDGFTITRVNSDNTKTSMNVDWVDQPHFYQYQNYMIYYIGRKSETLSALKGVFGDPVIG